MQVVKREPVDIEFSDLTYSVPIGRNRNKLLLRSVSGYFKAGELTAILGPSGAGKSTLLNVLAGYNLSDNNNSVFINGEPRDMKSFRKLSRYILQEDIHQPCLTVYESMQTAANLKLGISVSQEQKSAQIFEILDLLRLTNAKNTVTSRLSGGEKKRLSIALELVNNPPVLFLDEPTTGLDDLSSSQCIYLLKSLAQGGRTVICSIHTPSARLFALFDNIYILAKGQCIFQGVGENMIPFLSEFGLHCPVTYNPADFMIEVSSGEYGNHQDKLVAAVSNGRIQRWSNAEKTKLRPRRESGGSNEIKRMPEYACNFWQQFVIILNRMFIQMCRDWNIIFVKTLVHIGVGLVVGGLFYQFGHDASKALFNFGFCFISLIVFMYIPMLPAIVWFPQEVQSVKREYFNRWYTLNAYYSALTVSRLPFQIFQSMLYIAIVYIMTDQPMEWERILKFTVILGLVCLASEAYGMVISARLNIVNGIFLGPAMSVPMMLLAVYGIGAPTSSIPLWIRISMRLSYLRFGLEGLTVSIYGNNRENIICPDEEIYCPYKKAKHLLKEVGMENANYWIDVAALLGFFIIFKVLCYIILRHRLKRSRATGLVWLVGRFIKRYINLKH